MAAAQAPMEELTPQPWESTAVSSTKASESMYIAITTVKLIIMDK
jgi:hypothetical protein